MFETYPPSPPARAIHYVGHACRVPDVVNQLLATEVALDKLGARGIAIAETEQAIWNRPAERMILERS